MASTGSAEMRPTNLLRHPGPVRSCSVPRRYGNTTSSSTRMAPSMGNGPAASAPFAARAALVPVPSLKPGMLPYANLWWPVPNGSEVPSPEGLPTGTAYNYNSAVQKIHENFVMGRVDYVISPKDSIFGNY